MVVLRCGSACEPPDTVSCKTQPHRPATKSIRYINPGHYFQRYPPLHLPHICRALYQSAISYGHSSCWPRTTSFRTLCKPAVYSWKWCRWCCPRCRSRCSQRSGLHGSTAVQKHCRQLSRPATSVPVSSGQTCWTWRCRAAGECDNVIEGL